MYRTLQQQAGLWAYVDGFRLLALVCVVCIPLIMLFRKPAKMTGGPSLARTRSRATGDQACRTFIVAGHGKSYARFGNSRTFFRRVFLPP